MLSEPQGQEGRMGEHYSPEEIEEGLSGRLPAERSKEILRHLLRGCPECQAAIRQERLSLMAPRVSTLSPALSAAYDTTLNRAEDFARRAASLPPGERKRFRKALALLQTGNGVLAVTETGDMTLTGLGVYEALLARSWAVRYDNPKEMCNLAQAAVEISHRLDPETYGTLKVADYAARAWGELANAYRVSDRLRKAKKAFSTAFGFYHQGTRDRRLFIRLLDLEASLLGTLREFDLALTRLESLADLYQVAGETHLAGRTLITKALYLYYRGQSLEAYQTITDGLELVDKDKDPSLMIATAFNQLLLMEDCGRFREARTFLFKNRAQLNGAGHILTLKLRWIEGRISYGMGELESAEISFREVQNGFQEAGLDFACALASLDLAMTLMRQGRTQEAIQEGLASTAMFVSLSINLEIIGSVLFLEAALREQRASLSLLESTARFLRRKQIELGIK
jgi:tetratricopeptide (TPR) repeat protein